MNNITKDSAYRERWLTPLLRSAAKDHPVIVLTGARQVGKSTLLLNAEPFRSWRFHTLDDFGTLEQAKSNPESLWAGTHQIIEKDGGSSSRSISICAVGVDKFALDETSDGQSRGACNLFCP